MGEPNEFYAWIQNTLLPRKSEFWINKIDLGVIDHFWSVFCCHWIMVSHAAIIGRE